MQSSFTAFVELLNAPLLRWALRKEGSTQQAEELTQEIWMQFFSAVQREETRGKSVDQPEHLLWKIARNVWCRRLKHEIIERQMRCPLSEELADPVEFSRAMDDDSEKQQLLACMRQSVLRQSRQQREILLMYYLEQLSMSEIASRLSISPSTVKWHLFDTRKKIREDMTRMKIMEEKQPFVYRPGKLHVALSGNHVNHPDTEEINHSLALQNICLACYRVPQTTDSLSETLGIAIPYIEHDVQRLVDMEFLTEDRGRYLTAFQIETDADRQAVYAKYLKHRKALSDALVDKLLAKEQSIRAIGFTGADKPMNELLWLLIYLTCLQIPNPIPVLERPLRPDGGKYFPLGFTNGRVAAEIALDTRGWGYNGAMLTDNFFWFGTYNFAGSPVEGVMHEVTAADRELYRVLTELIARNFDYQDMVEKDAVTLSRLVEDGYLRMADGKAEPTFCVCSRDEYARLKKDVLDPVAESLGPAMKALADDLSFYAGQVLPPHLKHLMPLTLEMALNEVYFVSGILAFEAQQLKIPQNSQEGAFYTLMYVKP